MCTRAKAKPQKKEMLAPGFEAAHSAEREERDRVNVEPIFCPPEEISPCSSS
jgi:hypothetical protein